MGNKGIRVSTDPDCKNQGGRKSAWLSLLGVWPGQLRRDPIRRSSNSGTAYGKVRGLARCGVSIVHPIPRLLTLVKVWLLPLWANTAWCAEIVWSIGGLFTRPPNPMGGFFLPIHDFCVMLTEDWTEKESFYIMGRLTHSFTCGNRPIWCYTDRMWLCSRALTSSGASSCTQCAVSSIFTTRLGA